MTQKRCAFWYSELVCDSKYCSFRYIRLQHTRKFGISDWVPSRPRPLGRNLPMYTILSLSDSISPVPCDVGYAGYYCKSLLRLHKHVFQNISKYLEHQQTQNNNSSLKSSDAPSYLFTRKSRGDPLCVYMHALWEEDTASLSYWFLISPFCSQCLEWPFPGPICVYLSKQ